MPMRLAHEAIDAELEKHPEIIVRLQEMVESKELPPTYYDNPIVIANPNELVLPVDFFVDGLPYSLVDTVVGVWLINTITQRRHVLAVVRKRFCCKCGCRGWDTFYPVWLVIRWSLECMKNGVYPVCRHDGSPFRNIEAVRARVAGTALRIKACFYA